MAASPSYGAIANIAPAGMEWAESRTPSETSETEEGKSGAKRGCCIVLLVLLALVGLVSGGYFFFSRNDPQKIQQKLSSALLLSSSSMPMPKGVNVGSWLSLEDYFFAGNSAVEVATPDGDVAAVCLPPLHTGGTTGPTWNSETDLLANLSLQSGLLQAIRVFHAHRTSFFDFEEDLATLANLGIRSIRVPMSWCLTDEDPADIDPSMNNETLLEEQFTCQDPFFKDVRWPAVPRPLLVDFLRACAKHGIGATLDLHTYPGGTSPGTFSGVWPRWPRFWTHGDQPATDDDSDKKVVDVGRQLWKEMVEWVESLDSSTVQGLEALSPMNEPAHLAGIFANGKGEDYGPFLPPLPSHMAKEYRQKLQQATITTSKDTTTLTTVPDGPHLRVMKWLDDAVDVFRQSSLPKKGVKLMMNFHESALEAKVLPPHDGDDEGGRHPGAMRLIGAWWRGVTSAKERRTWAVLDLHHYHAWEPNCMGASDGHFVANYTCSKVEERNDALKRCSGWSTVYREAMDKECGPGALLMSGEMSASTHHSVRHACNDLSTLRSSYQYQLEAAKDAKVDLYWWSYKMPYGGAFRPAWSFKQFLYLMGVLPRPDESNYYCGDHVAIPNEPDGHVFDVFNP